MRGMKRKRDPPPQSSSMEIRVHPVGPPPLPSNHLRHRPPLPELRPFRRWFPWLVPSIVVANIVVFLAVMFVNDCPKNIPNSCLAPFLGRLSFQPIKENPLLGPSADTLDKMGALDVTKIVKENQEWRLISCIWLHAGVFHLLANMLGLMFIGIRLEQEFGFVRIGFVYVASGFGGSLLSSLFIQSGISVGASGALFGLLGGMLSELITNWTMYANKLAALTTLILIIVLNLAVGILPHVDNFAHIGGFISGFFLGFVFLIRPQFDWVEQKNYPSRYDGPSLKSKHKPYQYVLWIVSFIILIAGYTIGLVFLLRGNNLNDHCSWCHYLSCVPTSLWSCKSRGKVYCESTEFGNHVNLTCLSIGKNNTYLVSGSNSSQSQIQQLCSQLCG